MELERSGRVMLGRSRTTQEQADAAQERMVAQYPITVGEIEALVASIAAQIARLPPDRILQRGWWEYLESLSAWAGEKQAI